MTSLSALLFLLLALKQFLNNRRVVQPDEAKARYILYLDIVLVFGVVSNYIGRTSVYSGFPFIILLSLTSVFLLSSSIFEFDEVKRYVQIILGEYLFVARTFVLIPPSSVCFLQKHQRVAFPPSFLFRHARKSTASIQTNRERVL